MSLFSSKSKSESKVIPYDAQQLNEIVSRIGTLGRTPVEMYPDQMYADMTPEQRAALDMRREFAGGLGQMTAPALEAWQTSLSAPDVANNPYVQGMIGQNEASLQRSLAEMMPTIESGMLGVNERLGGSGEGVAKGIAARGTQEALARANAATMLDAYGKGLGQQQFAMSAAPGMAQFGMMPADVMMGIGDVERAEAQRGISEDVARFNFAQQEPWQRTQNQLSLFNAATLPYAATKTKAQGTPSVFDSFLDAASVAMGAMGMGTPSRSGGVPAPASQGVPGGYAAALNPQITYNMPTPNRYFPGAGMGFQGGAF